MRRLLALLLLMSLVPTGPAAAQELLTFDEIIEAEIALAEGGYAPGPANGVMGEQSTRALRLYQSDWRLPETGVLTPELHARLTREHPQTRPQWFPVAGSNCEVWNDAPQPQESATWTGGCADGRISGEGVLVWRSVHAGQVREQRHEGRFANGQEEGYGVTYYVDGGRYEGSFEDGDREGQGTRYLPDGSRYEGGWRDNLPHGAGTLTMADGRVFSGTWSQGCLLGQQVAVETSPAYCAF